MATTLDGTDGRKPLDRPGWTIRAPGVHGRVDVSRPALRGPGTRSPEAPEPALEEALAEADFTELASVVVETARVERSPEGAALRAPGDGTEAMELEVPEFDGYGQVALLADEAGILSWHFPAESEAWPEARRTTRGGGTGLRYRIPNTPAPTPEEGATRSLVGRLGKKVLKVLAYPLVGPLVEAGVSAFARRWEDDHRPHTLRIVTPADYAATGGRPVTAGDWNRLREGPVLLLVHGTFSTVRGAFGSLPASTVEELCHRYGGRVLGFDHPTLSRTPEDNARWLLDGSAEGGLPGDVAMDVDIVCHSRGGLVARCLEAANPFGVDAGRLGIRRTVFVGVPNAGTILADPDHVIGKLDRMTNLVNLIPGGGVEDVLDAVLTVLKVLGRGGLESLVGLVSMRPGGSFLARLNDDHGADAPTYFAVAADYEPADPGLVRLVKGAADAAVDRVFEGDANDLVVPEAGVYTGNGAPGFPIDGSRLLRLEPELGTMHTTIFANPRVVARLGHWLEA